MQPDQNHHSTNNTEGAQNDPNLSSQNSNYSPEPTVISPGSLSSNSLSQAPISKPLDNSTHLNNPATLPDSVGLAMPTAVVGSQPQAEVFNVAPASTVGGAQPPKKRFSLNKRKILLGSGIATLAVLIFSGLVFGLYLPNTPTGAWNTGINRTGKALDALVTTATDKDKLTDYKTAEITGNAQIKTDGTTYKGDFTTDFDAKNVNAGLTVTMNDNGTLATIQAKLITQIPKNSTFPNVYFQISGLKSLGLDEIIPKITAYDGKWIYVSADYLKSIGEGYVSTGDNTKENVTSADIAEVVKAASSVSKEYVFSTSEDKAVLVKKSFVGKEEVDGLKAYHYKVGINVENAKAYCIALSDSVISTNAYKKVFGVKDEDIQKTKQDAKKDCQQQTNNDLKASDSFDLWIDAKYKLVYKVRFSEKDGAYNEVGQLYKGGDDLTLFVNNHGGVSKTDGKFTLTTNFKTLDTSGKYTYTDPSSSANVSFKAKVSSKAVNITKPANAIPFETVLNDILGL